jgi:NodT family efflux transporter outer membrane factor (OMF) lipoprotein
MSTSARTRTGAALTVALAVGGCAVGPDFQRPPPPRLETYGGEAAGPSPVPGRLEADGATQTLMLGRPTDPKWWRLFKAPALDALVEAGLTDSPTLAAARETLIQSRSQARAGAGVFFPSLDVSLNASNQRYAPLQIGEPTGTPGFNIYTLTGTVGYVFDPWGGERRGVEALNAAAGHARYSAAAAYLTLTGSIVQTAIAEAGYADQAAACADIVRLETEQRDILDAERRAGRIAAADALDAEQQLAQDRRALSDARQRRLAAASLLRTLLGREPAEATPAPPALSDLALPEELPVSLPSQLVRQRPDVLQAEADLHQASAEVGVATAALYPSFVLSSAYGGAAGVPAQISALSNRFWLVGPTLDVPILEGGARWYGRKAAQAAWRAKAAQYRVTVLAALQQTADVLRALEGDAETARAGRGVYDAAELKRSLGATRRRAGLLAEYDAMTLAIQADRARLGLIDARSQRLQDVVALYVATGGGWTPGDVEPRIPSPRHRPARPGDPG